MEESVSVKTKVLGKLSSKEVAEQNEKYVDDRRKGLITSLKTKFTRLDNYLMGGIELDTIMCLSALSGGGKSTLAKCMRESINSLNPNMEFNQYIFNFEMIAHQQAGRTVVTKANIPLKKLYSVDEPLSDADFAQVKLHYDAMKSRDNVWFIETPGTATEIVSSLWHYYLTECKSTGKVLVYELDHALLTKGREGASEKERVDEVMYALVYLKKRIAADGGHSIGIVLSQMNRDIRKIERIKDKQLHRPNTGDLFGASSIEQCCDYIIFSHIPAKLNISSYTTNEYPTIVTIGTINYQIPYFELVKQRSGESDLTIPLWNKLDRFDFDEMDKDVFYKLLKQFQEHSTCVYNPQKSLF